MLRIFRIKQKSKDFQEGRVKNIQKIIAEKIEPCLKSCIEWKAFVTAMHSFLKDSKVTGSPSDKNKIIYLADKIYPTNSCSDPFAR